MRRLVGFCLMILCVQVAYGYGRYNKYEKKLSRIRIRDKWFVDDQQRVVVFHGVNVVHKKAPWTPTEPFNDLTNETQLVNLKQWGFNVVRLGLMWSGLMPAKDYVNQTYLDEIVTIVNNLASYGIYVIIDLHQDMLSSKFDSYDGAPLWLLNEMPKSRTNFPWPLSDQAINQSVFAAYVTESCGFAFQCLYDNVNGFGDYFVQYWDIVSRTFVGNTAVLGYELLNEPWAGDVYANPLLLLPGVAGRFNLMKLYDMAYNAIRNNDNDTLVFYEPVTWGVLLDRNYFGTGLRAPGHDPNRTVLSWHYYCWLLQVIADNPLKNGTYPKFDKIFCDDIQLRASFDTVRLDMMALGGGPSFLTEFGVCAFPIDPSDRKSRLNTDECEAILDANDRYLQSWCYWDTNFYDNKTLELIPQMVDIFSRVYPTSTNGIPQSVYFNTTTKEFVYKYRLNITDISQAKQPTEIHIPPQLYPNGFRVLVSPNLTWWFDKLRFKLLVMLQDHIFEAFYVDEFYSFHQDSFVSVY